MRDGDAYQQMNKLARNYVYNVSYQILVLIAPLFTAPYLARVLGADALGTSSYITTVSNVFTTIGMLGIQNYSIRQIAYVKHDQRELKKEFSDILMTRFSLGIATTACYFVLIYVSDSRMLFLIQIFYVVAYFLDPCWFFIGMEDMGPVVARNFAAKLACVAGIFLFIKSEQDLYKYVFLLSITTLLPSLAAIPLLKRYGVLDGIKLPTIKTVKKHIRGSLHVFWPQVATLIYLQTDKVLLKWFVSSSSVAFYDQAEKLVKIPLTLITALSTVMMPRLAAEYNTHNTEKIQSYLGGTIRFSMMLACPMMLGIAGIAGTLIPWYLGDAFIPVTRAVRVLCPIIILSSLIGISGDQYLVATEQTDYLTKSYVVAAIANVAIDVISIPAIGILGAAIGTLAAQGISCVMQYNVMLRQVSVGKTIMDSLRYLLYSIPMLACVACLEYYLPTTWVTTLMQISCGILIYFIMLVITRDTMLQLVFRKVKSITCLRSSKMKKE